MTQENSYVGKSFQGHDSQGSKLPRLLYYGACPVEPTSAGAILLHRLFEGWPSQKLLICSPSSPAECRLPKVKCYKLPQAPLNRLFTTRLGKAWATILTLINIFMLKKRKGQPQSLLAEPIKEFRPEAVITIGVAGAWYTAAEIAKNRGIPLYLIMHDEGHYDYFWVQPLKKFGTYLFGEVYRQAKARFCISTPMISLYQKRFGEEGTLLLPFRGRGDKVFQEVRKPASESPRIKKIYYAGSIYGGGFRELEKIAEALSACHCELIVYTPSKPVAEQNKYLKIRKAIPSNELIQVLHQDADALLLWTSFAKEAREAVRTLFPSKMVDYTAAAVPIVVLAPEDACISHYLKEKPNIGYLIHESCPKTVARQIADLLNKPTECERLAQGAILAGTEEFSFEANFSIFKNKLLQA